MRRCARICNFVCMNTSQHIVQITGVGDFWSVYHNWVVFVTVISLVEQEWHHLLRSQESLQAIRPKNQCVKREDLEPCRWDHLRRGRLSSPQVRCCWVFRIWVRGRRASKRLFCPWGDVLFGFKSQDWGNSCFKDTLLYLRSNAILILKLGLLFQNSPWSRRPPELRVNCASNVVIQVFQSTCTLACTQRRTNTLISNKDRRWDACTCMWRFAAKSQVAYANLFRNQCVSIQRWDIKQWNESHCN